jgi:SAM-dependent methyltransferase
MSSLNILNSKVTFMDYQNNETVLLNITPLENHSNVPTHQLKADSSYDGVFAKWLASLLSQFDVVNQNVSEGLTNISVFLSVFFVIKQLMEKHRDYKVLEIGCDNGVLSYYLANVLKHFNPHNQLVCLTEVQQDSSADLWLDKIMASKAEDIVSRFTTDYLNAFLQKDIFDIVIINGSVCYENPSAVIFNAINCLRNGGLLICSPNKQYYLSEIFEALVDNYSEYAIDNASSVFTKTIEKKEKWTVYRQSKEYKYLACKKDAIALLSSINEEIQELGTSEGPRNLDNAIRQIGHAEDDILAIYSRLNSLNIKFEISELKEAMINYRIADTIKEQKADAEQCRKKYQTVIQTMQKADDFQGIDGETFKS